MEHLTSELTRALQPGDWLYGRRNSMYEVVEVGPGVSVIDRHGTDEFVNVPLLTLKNPRGVPFPTRNFFDYKVTHTLAEQLRSRLGQGEEGPVKGDPAPCNLIPIPLWAWELLEVDDTVFDTGGQRFLVAMKHPSGGPDAGVPWCPRTYNLKYSWPGPHITTQDYVSYRISQEMLGQISGRIDKAMEALRAEVSAANSALAEQRAKNESLRDTNIRLSSDLASASLKARGPVLEYKRPEPGDDLPLVVFENRAIKVGYNKFGKLGVTIEGPAEAIKVVSALFGIKPELPISVMVDCEEDEEEEQEAATSE